MINTINMNESDRTRFCTFGSQEACRILGISRDTLYAYVSRGLVRAVAHPGDARRSLYDRRDIETLSARQIRGRSRRAVAESTLDWGEPVLVSRITRIADGGFSYRGVDAVGFSKTATLEDALALLADLPPHRGEVSPATPATPAIAGGATPFGRMLTAMAALAATPETEDGPEAAQGLLRRAALAAIGARDAPALPIHELIARAWSKHAHGPELIRRALVLCADHELNASTYAARVAASAGATLPACLLAGLATLSGSRHGGLTSLCRAWMRDVEAAKDRGRRFRPEEAPPSGFGHALYPDGDPRAAELIRHCGSPPRWRDIIAQVHKKTGSHPTLDFGLALLEAHAGLPQGGGQAIFAIGRTTGWLAHSFEQQQTGKLIRPRAAYANPHNE